MRTTLIFFSLLTINPALADTYVGEVVAIADGDTFTLLTDEHNQMKVRLAEIDTPEERQPYADKAKDLLSELIFRKRVTVEGDETDRYGRVVGTTYTEAADGQLLNVNEAMVSIGAAWVYRKYANTPIYYELEKSAQEEKKGLWALPVSDRIPPWEWRHPSREEADQRSYATISSEERRATDFEKRMDVSPDDFSCGSKRYCRQMNSCAEARFYLNECGLSRLDGDSDGIPCEKLC